MVTEPIGDCGFVEQILYNPIVTRDDVVDSSWVFVLIATTVIDTDDWRGERALQCIQVQIIMFWVVEEWSTGQIYDCSLRSSTWLGSVVIWVADAVTVSAVLSLETTPCIRYLI